MTDTMETPTIENKKAESLEKSISHYLKGLSERDLQIIEEMTRLMYYSKVK